MPDTYGFIKSLTPDTRAQMDAEYKKAPAVTNSFDIPDGKYVGYVDRAMMKESKKIEGTFGISIWLCIMEPNQYAGRRCQRYVPIDPADPVRSMEHVKPVLFALGFRWDGIESLDEPERFEEILDKIVTFRITHKGERRSQHIWIDSTDGKVSEQQREYYGTMED